MLDLPSGEAKIFLAAHGIAAIYIALIGPGRFVILPARDVSRSFANLNSKWPGADIRAIFWVEGRSKARRVCVLAHDDLQQADSILTAAAIEAAVARAAVNAGVRLTGHGVMTNWLQNAIKEFDERLSIAKAAGHLQFFNRAYREHRLAHAEQGRRFMTFAEATARMRRYLIACHAKKPRALQICEGELLRYVFDGKQSNDGNGRERTKSRN